MLNHQLYPAMLLSAAMLTAGTALAEPALLDAEDAFRLSASADGDTVVLRWRIADDYYMYRNRFAVEAVGTQDVYPGELLRPPGIVKKDPQFGEVEVYYEQAVIRLPFKRGADAAGLAALPLRLRVTGQGCNEPVGVCYPPLIQETKVVLAAADNGFDLSSALDNLPTIGGGKRFLPVEEAFRASLTATDHDALEVEFYIAPGYYLYRDKIGLRSLAADVALAPWTAPPGVPKTDAYFGDTEVYERDFRFAVRVTPPPPTVRKAPFELSWQGCAVDGICYLPVKARFDAEVGGTGTAAVFASTGAAGAGTSFSWAWLLTAFGAGLLLTFTPCVLPMIPILSGIIVGGGGTAKPGRLHGGLLSVLYVLGTAVTYAATGAVAGATGDQLQAWFQHPLLIGLAALFISTMALAMFGVFHLQTPGALQTRIHHWGATRGGKAGMVFVLGMVSALLIGACVSPVLFSVLGAALSSADPLFGALTMFSMALGMGVVLIAIGFGLGALAPRAGAWLQTMQHGFGVLLLAVALYLLGAIPAIPVQVLWGLLFLLLAAFISSGRLLPQLPGGTGTARGIGLFLLMWGAIAVVGGFAGNRNPLQPLDVFLSSGGGGGGVQVLADGMTVAVSSNDEFDRVLADARNSGRAVVLNYHADWCLDCNRFHETTLRDPQVRQQLAQRFIFAEVDIGDPLEPDSRALRRRFDVFGPPAIVLFNTRGEVVRLSYGYHSSKQFLALLRSI